MTCNKWDIVVVPFPFVDSLLTKPRPALVLSQKQWNRKNAHTLLAMITTAKHSKWSSDICIGEGKSTGLSHASVIRLKFFTLDNRIIQKTIGVLDTKEQMRIQKGIQEMMD